MVESEPRAAKGIQVTTDRMVILEKWVTLGCQVLEEKGVIQGAQGGQANLGLLVIEDRREREEVLGVLAYREKKDLRGQMAHRAEKAKQGGEETLEQRGHREPSGGKEQRESEGCKVAEVDLGKRD